MLQLRKQRFKQFKGIIKVAQLVSYKARPHALPFYSKFNVLYTSVAWKAFWRLRIKKVKNSIWRQNL